MYSSSTETIEAHQFSGLYKHASKKELMGTRVLSI